MAALQIPRRCLEAYCERVLCATDSFEQALQDCFGKIKVALSGHRLETVETLLCLLARQVCATTGGDGGVRDPGWIANDQNGLLELRKDFFKVDRKEIGLCDLEL
jgi:hypothetical protein